MSNFFITCAHHYLRFRVQFVRTSFAPKRLPFTSKSSQSRCVMSINVTKNNLLYELQEDWQD